MISTLSGSTSKTSLTIIPFSLQEIENIQHILWLNFQDSAHYTAALYKDRTSSNNNLIHFQRSAIATTRLYKGMQRGIFTCIPRILAKMPSLNWATSLPSLMPSFDGRCPVKTGQKCLKGTYRIHIRYL